MRDYLKVLAFTAVLVAVVLLAMSWAWGAPNFSRVRSLEPETNLTYHFGTSTLQWLSIYFANATGTALSLGTSTPPLKTDHQFSLQGSALLTSLTVGRLVATSAPQLTNLVNCNTLDTNGQGVLACGTDETASLSGGNPGAITYWDTASALLATSTIYVSGVTATGTSPSIFDGGIRIHQRAFFGMATATPGAMLSVAGEGLFGGRLTASIVSATSTLEVGKDVLTDITGNQLTITGGALGVSEGSGSGLDADTLDAIDSGSFLRSDASDTFSLTTGILDLTSGARFGIGTGTPGAALGVRGEGLFDGRLTVNNILATSTTVFSGIGTTSPFGLLSIEQGSTNDRTAYALVVGDTGTSTPAFGVNMATNTTRIATTSDSQVENAKLYIGGLVYSAAQWFSAVFRPTSAATTTIDCSAGGPIFNPTAMGANTVLEFKNCQSGMRWLVEIAQDGTGGRSLSIPGTAVYTVSGNLRGTPTTTANAVNVVGGYFNGNVNVITYASATPPR